MVTVLGLGFLFSAVNVRYRDVRYMIPVFLQVLPLLSGVMWHGRGDPHQVAVVLAFNPMTAVIAGWRWAVLDAATPNVGQTAIGVAVALVLFVGGLAVFRSSEPASRTRSDGDRDRGARALEEVPAGRDAGGVRDARESLSHAARRALRQEHREREGGDLGAQGRLLRGSRRPGLGVIGRNGAGKSTLLKVLTRITTPTSGRVEIRGRREPARGRDGFHPELTGATTSTSTARSSG